MNFDSQETIPNVYSPAYVLLLSLIQELSFKQAIIVLSQAVQCPFNQHWNINIFTKLRHLFLLSFFIIGWNVMF